MNRILSPPPRRMTRIWQMERTAVRYAGVLIASVGMVVVVAAVTTGVVFPFVIPGAVALVASVSLFRTGMRRLELWLDGVEMTAEAQLGKQALLTWRFEGRTYTGQAMPQVLLWVNGQARILVDPTDPSRMTPVTVDMAVQSEPVEPPPAVAPVLPPRPRAGNDRVLSTARLQGIVAALSVVIAFGVACIVAPLVLERRQFLAEAARVGPARVVGRTSSEIQYAFEGVSRTFAARGKAQARWPVGAEVPLYRHQGLLVVEPELPGMAMSAGIVLVGLPVLATVGMLAASIREAQRARKLWRWGKEVTAEIISDRTIQSRREVICRFVSAAGSGIARRNFAASRQPLEGARGEAVVLVDPSDPRVSRIILADEP